MFNPEKYKDRIIKSYENFIDLDLDEIIKYDTHFWKSPPGTGKTFVMKKLIHKLNIKSIISITSRVNLAGEHMGDLELEFYKKTNIKKSKKLAIQLESLYKCRLDNYTDGILILDEVNSLLTHFRSPTVTNKRSLNFVCLIELIKSAKYVICLDADMCDWNIEFINKIRNNKTNNIPINFGFAGDEECDNIINQNIENKTSEYLVYYNVFPNKLDVPATIYECEYRMIYEMVKLAKENTVFVSCFDSLSYMECVINFLSDYIPKEKMLIYSSKVDYGIINTKDWKDKYVFYSPSIIYGV
jgi:Cdc6-like AAA superfamily ATPase